MNEEYAYRPVEEVKTKGNFVKAITFKPYSAIIICAAFGIAMLLVSNLYARILGAVFILFSFFVLKEVRDYKVMDIFDEGVMIYEDRENRSACFVDFESIREWKVTHEKGIDAIVFLLNSGQIIQKNTFAADKAYKALYGLIWKKESRYLHDQHTDSFSLKKIFQNVSERYRRK